MRFSADAMWACFVCIFMILSQCTIPLTSAAAPSRTPSLSSSSVCNDIFHILWRYEGALPGSTTTSTTLTSVAVDPFTSDIYFVVLPTTVYRISADGSGRYSTAVATLIAVGASAAGTVSAQQLIVDPGSSTSASSLRMFLTAHNDFVYALSGSRANLSLSNFVSGYHLTTVGVCPDGSCLYATEHASTIRKYALPSLAVTSVGTLPGEGLSTPVAGGLRGMVYCATYSSNRILAVDAAGATVVLAGSPTGVAGYVDAKGTDARFNYPLGIAFGVVGDVEYLFVGDQRNCAIRRIRIHDVEVTTIAGGGGCASATLPATNVPARSARIGPITGLCFVNHTASLYVVDPTFKAIYRILLTAVDCEPSATKWKVTQSGETASSSAASSASWSKTALTFSAARSASWSLTFSTVRSASWSKTALTFTTVRSVSWSLSMSLSIVVVPTPSLTVSGASSPTVSHATPSRTDTPLRSPTYSFSIVGGSVSRSTTGPTQAASITYSHNGTSLTSSVSGSRVASTSRTVSHATRSCTATHASSPSRTLASSRSCSGSAQTRSVPRTRSPTETATPYCALARSEDGAVFTLLHFNVSAAVAQLAAGSSPLSTIVGATHPIEPTVASLPRTPAAAPAVQAAPVSRQVLSLSPPLALNTTIHLSGSGVGAAWRVAAATVEVGTGGASSVSVALLSSTVSSNMPSPNGTHLSHLQRQAMQWVVLPPGNGTSARWLPSSISTFREVTLTLLFVLQCPTDPDATETASIVLTSPGQQMAFAAEVKAASSATQWTSSLSGPSAGGAVGRASSVRSLVLCSSDDPLVPALFELSVGAAGCDDGPRDSLTALARGSVLGNLLAWAAASLLLFLVAMIYACCTGTTVRSSAVALGLPSPLLPLLVVTLPSSVSATFFLLRGAGGCAVDWVVLLVGLAMSLLPVAALLYVAVVVPRTHEPQPANERTKRASPSRCQKLIPAHLASAFQRNVRWVARTTSATTSLHACAESGSGVKWGRVTTVVLLEYAVLWYAALDVGVLTAAGVLGAMSTLDSTLLCRGSGLALLVLYGGQLVVCAWARPFTTLFSYVHALCTLVLTCTSVAMQLAYLYRSAEASVDLAALEWMLVGSSLCDLLVMGISIPRTLFDGAEAFLTFSRHATVSYNAFVERRRGHNEVAEPISCVIECNDCEVTLPLDDDNLDDADTKLEPIYDRFWSSDGRAIAAAGDDTLDDDDDALCRILTAKERLAQQNSRRLSFLDSVYNPSCTSW